MLNGAIPAFLIYSFAHQYLLLLVEQHYLFFLVECNFMKKGKLLFRVLGFLVHFLLDKVHWPYFAPLCILFLCGWIAKRQLLSPFLTYQLSKCVLNLPSQVHFILAAHQKINSLIFIDPLSDTLQVRITLHSNLISPQQFQSLAGLLLPDRPNYKLLELKLDLILLRQILLYFYHY